ncbi:MAG: hypothetical protein QM679_06155 [Patulibacter sp.]
MTHPTDPNHDAALWEEALTTTDGAAQPAAQADDGTTEPSGGVSADASPGQRGRKRRSKRAGGGASGDRHGEAPSSGRAKRPRPGRRTVTVLGSVILLAGGFTGGVLVQKHRGSSGAGGAMAGGGASGGMPGGGGMPSGGMRGGSSSSGSSSSGSAASGAAPGGSSSGASSSGSTPSGSQSSGSFPGGSASSSANMTVGSVANVRGSTLYVETSDGTTVRVVAASGATATRTSKVSMTGVHPGDSVVISGETDDDGTVKATSVRATASNASGN